MTPFGPHPSVLSLCSTLWSSWQRPRALTLVLECRDSACYCGSPDQVVGVSSSAVCKGMPDVGGDSTRVSPITGCVIGHEKVGGKGCTLP